VIVQAVLNTGTRMLREAGVEDPIRDARILLAASLGIKQGRLTLHIYDQIDREMEAAFLANVVERCEGKPVSHLLGQREFFGRQFNVNPAVLDPRPDTETLIEAALSKPFLEVLDLGIGSGCILLTLLSELPEATGIGTDVSEAALTVAQINANALGVSKRCALIESNWFEAVGGRYDLIVSNPPYIAADEMEGLEPELSFEPRVALTDDSDGLSAYRVIVPGAGAHLTPGGRLLVEIGWRQGEAVSTLFQEAGFETIAVSPDLEGRDRVVSGVWPK